jgi:hypothetical protein
VNFYVVGASGLNITMDIAPHSGISFSADQVTTMNYSLSSHGVQINPVLVGDYNLINLGHWPLPLVMLSILNLYIVLIDDNSLFQLDRTGGSFLSVLMVYVMSY